MAAVNGIIASALGDLTTTEAINAEFLLLLAERGDLGNHPALYHAGSIDGKGANVLKIGHAGLMGYDVPGAVGDGTAVPNTAFTDGSTTITVARQAKSYEASDLARMVAGNVINPSNFAMDAAVSHSQRLIALICAIIDGFTPTAGSTGVDLDTATLLGAAGTSRVNNVGGALMTILHGQQWKDVVVDAGSALGGALQFSPATQSILHLNGSGFQGQWLGQDIFVNNRVVTANAGADRAGAVFGYGGVLIADGTPPTDDPSNQMLVGSKVLFERDRSAKPGETAFVSSSFQGVSLGLASAGTTITSDA